MPQATSDPKAAVADTLYAPDRERIATTNAWAFLHWLAATRGMRLAGWAGLEAFSAADPAGFAEALAGFAGLADEPRPLARHAGPRDALLLRQAGGGWLVLSCDALLAGPSGLPDPIAALLRRNWPSSLLVRPLAALLLHADLRPDDRVLVADRTAWPWLAALLQGTTVMLAPPTMLLAAAAETAATVIVAPAAAVAEAAHRRAGGRPDLGALRTILVTGGPLAPAARRRIYTWIKSDLMVLARSGNTVWGNPLQPVLARPKPSPALLAATQAARRSACQ